MKTLTRRDLEKRLDRLCSLWVRYHYSFNGKCKCYTCGKVHTIKDTDNGHFAGRACRPLRWEKDNMRPQCTLCNRYLNGNLARYYVHLKKDNINADYLLEIEDRWKKGKIKPPTMLELRKKYNIWLADVRKLDSSLIPDSWKLIDI